MSSAWAFHASRLIAPPFHHKELFFSFPHTPPSPSHLTSPHPTRQHKQWPKYTTDEVSKHRTASDLWLICRSRDPKTGSLLPLSNVLDVSTKCDDADADKKHGNWSASLFRRGHPGGDDILLKRAGTDVSEEFHFAVRHTKEAQEYFAAFKVGEVDWTPEEVKAMEAAEAERKKKEGGGCAIC